MSVSINNQKNYFILKTYNKKLTKDERYEKEIYA